MALVWRVGYEDGQKIWSVSQGMFTIGTSPVSARSSAYLAVRLSKYDKNDLFYFSNVNCQYQQTVPVEVLIVGNRYSWTDVIPSMVCLAQCFCHSVMENNCSAFEGPCSRTHTRYPLKSSPHRFRPPKDAGESKSSLIYTIHYCPATIRRGPANSDRFFLVLKRLRAHHATVLLSPWTIPIVGSLVISAASKANSSCSQTSPLLNHLSFWALIWLPRASQQPRNSISSEYYLIRSVHTHAQIPPIHYIFKTLEDVVVSVWKIFTKILWNLIKKAIITSCSRSDRSFECVVINVSPSDCLWNDLLRR